MSDAASINQAIRELNDAGLLSLAVDLSFDLGDNTHQTEDQDPQPHLVVIPGKGLFGKALDLLCADGSLGKSDVSKGERTLWHVDPPALHGLPTRYVARALSLPLGWLQRRWALRHVGLDVSEGRGASA